MDYEIGRDEILAKNPLRQFLERGGAVLRPKGEELYTLCPFHQDGKRGNLRIKESDNTWYCDICKFGGSVIDYVHRLKNISIGEAMRELAGNNQSHLKPAAPRSYQPPADDEEYETAVVPQPRSVSTAPSTLADRSNIKATYDYVDQTGKLIFQSVRYEPKDFKQRQPDGKGGWLNHLHGVTRVLYRLPRVIRTEKTPIWIVEGEKDVETLESFGITATCNPGGAEKWLDPFSEYLKGKEVVVCPDNDVAGEKHRDMVMKSIADYARNVRLIRIPEPHKDVSDLAQAEGKERTLEILEEKFNAAVVLVGGIVLPVYTMEEIEADYRLFVSNAQRSGSVDIGKWLPTLAKCIRPLTPGDFAVLIADTGIGKTAFLQNLVFHSDMECLFFEMEVTRPNIFERFVRMATGMSGEQVENAYKFYSSVAWRDHPQLHKLMICDRSRLTTDTIEEYIIKSELKFGCKPKLVIVDYLQLIKGKGTRYERFSDIAEHLKAIAKNTSTVIFAASQISRKGDNEGTEVFLHDAKDSGSIENSAGLILGAWRGEEKMDHMIVKILKCTNGKPGARVTCLFNGEQMIIQEKPKIEKEDYTV